MPSLVPPPPAWKARRDTRAPLYRATGAWRDETIADIAVRRAAETPNRVAIIDGDDHVTFARLLREASNLAGYLIRRGLRAGAVVSYQLPNWYEAAVVNLAACLAGFVVNPLVPIYRDHEISFMLADCRSSALFVPERFRSFDHLAMVHRLRPTLPDLAEVIVVRGRPGNASTTFTDTIAAEPAAATPIDPDSLKLVLYTSGTTGRAKGVLHTHNTVLSAIHAFGVFWNVTPADTIFMASPVSHITGYLYALEQPLVLGTAAVLMDVWQADKAAALIRAHGCNIAFGATPFLKDLADTVEQAGISLPSLRLFPCGGAPVPPDLVYRASDLLRPCTVCRIYGATETSGPVAFGVRSRDLRLAAETDGEIFNAEVRITNPSTGELLPGGAEGEILTRGPQNFVGYLRAEDDAAAFDRDGFFRTGDLGRIAPPGYIVTTGRAKDIIIRGGENLSPREIEDLLVQHPAIREAAVVGMPDARLGEAVCAFVTCNEGFVIDTAEAARFLADRQMARQKIPTWLEVLPQLPKTPSGKVRKDVLREQATCLAPGSSSPGNVISVGTGPASMQLARPRS